MFTPTLCEICPPMRLLILCRKPFSPDTQNAKISHFEFEGGCHLLLQVGGA